MCVVPLGITLGPFRGSGGNTHLQMQMTSSNMVTTIGQITLRYLSIPQTNDVLNCLLSFVDVLNSF